jgi:hypothetical protein
VVSRPQHYLVSRFETVNVATPALLRCRCISGG